MIMTKIPGVFWLIFIFPLSVFGQGQGLSISGVVTNTQNDSLAFVSVFVSELGLGTFTNEFGFFNLEVPSKNTEIVVSCLGYKQKVISVSDLSELRGLKIVLSQDLLILKTLTVVAEKIVNKEGSSVYSIENQAIKQIQAFNLSDVFGLLPGHRMVSPDLTKNKQAHLRTAIASAVDAFGTAVVLDGMILSNDANFQAKNPSSTLNGGKATPGAGIDLRSIPLTNVESVQIISGVPSAKYGNLSGGAILVKSKIGKSPWITTANVNYTNYQVSVSKGFELPSLGVLNSDFSYGYSSGSPTERKMYYQTFNLGLRWKLPELKKIKLNHFTSLRVIHSEDGNRHEPDELYKNEADVKSTLYSLGFSGNFMFYSFLNTHISYNVNGSLSAQHSYFDVFGKNGPFPIVEATKSSTYITRYSPLVYRQTTEIRGMPINLNARLEASQFFEKGMFDFNFETGLQFSLDDNKGSGRVSTGNIAHVADIAGSRSATFHQFPASRIFSVYHQSRVKLKGRQSMQLLSFGIRYDNMPVGHNLFSPRLFFSSKYQNFTFNAAWGRAYKAPAMIQLYPGKTFIDYVNLSYYAKNPKSRAALVTTYLREPDNTQLKPNFSDLKELGFVWNPSFLNFQFTYFNKALQRGIQHTSTLVFLPLQGYKILETPIDKPPVFAPIPGNVINIPRTLGVLKNNYFVNTDGFELILSGIKIEKTNTEFNFRYSYLKSLRTDLGYNIIKSNFVIGDKKSRFGIYEQTKLKKINSFGTLTLIQHLPSLRFVVTLAAELNFKRYEIYKAKSRYPYAYYDTSGYYTEIPESERSSPAFSDLILSEKTHRPLADIPFHANFNLQVRKETPQGHSFSFYANNAPWYNPEYERNGAIRRLNKKLQVGFSCSLTIK